MTKDDAKDATVSEAGLDRLNGNIAKVEALSTRLVAALGQKKSVRDSLQAPNPELFAKAATAYFSEMMANPSKLIEQQVGYWGKTLQQYMEAQEHLVEGTLQPVADSGPEDPRFSNPMWATNPYFNYVKQQYLFNAQAISDAVRGIEVEDPRDKQRLEFFSRQIMDMLSPTNFLATNPEALTKAVETEGQSLVDGLENLVRDIEANEGDLLVTLADRNAFKVGENLATTPGSVVFRNRMFELIQYAPTTEKVHAIPLLIFPPWINKFYILDMKEKNSLIKWLVDQGHSVFVVSWVNPDASYADVGLEQYVQEGYLTAIDQVKKITGQKQINATGYCIGGTTLSLTLALMAKRGDTSVNSATFFTTLTDFSDQGEIGVFLNDDFVDGIEAECTEHGILHSFFMSRTFSYLRSNDLIYRPAIRSYMMGEAPPAFDLLFWNGDSTNLPGRMAVQYLRHLCQKDEFADGGFEFLGETLTSSDVKVPLMAIACETDHIAAWKASYTSMRAMGSDDKRFVVSQSGHIAGIVNPPSKKKYGHYSNADWPAAADDWMTGASFSDGSWWPAWDAWLSERSGKQVAARKPGAKGRKILAAAPGTYVISTANN
jgi:polyhydroxyalkanoate synthase subunit PhaC